MGFVGLIVTFVGFPARGQRASGSRRAPEAAWASCSSGSSISLVGILGVINPAYQKNAVWKK